MAAPRATLQLALRHPGEVAATAGVHPHDAALAPASAREELRTLCADPGVVAVGECGLDYHYDRSPRPLQRDWFAFQLELARELGKPVTVHSREADVETADLLRQHLGPAGGVVHCFTSDWAAARRYLDLGLSISIAGIVTFKTAEALREAARQIPLDRLLVETDSPYLAPVPLRGKRNEPAFVEKTARFLAALRGEPFELLCEATAQNAARLFRLGQGARGGGNGV
jgi:TatD DNase family protein